MKVSTRTRLADAALVVSYRRGFRNTAIADIAKQANVPLGNVYYHFASKEQIGEAVIQLRVERLARHLAALDKLCSPQERLCGFVRLKIDRREELARRGCPVGTLCSELHKEGGPLAEKATALLESALLWLERQFQAMGQGSASKSLALHLLSATQGVSLLAHAFGDPSLINAEAHRLMRWIREF
jgi:TetR/AcrR family transcriptional regulator, transcriptional repressor for nem operon